MTAVRIVTHTLVRTAVLAIGIVAYDRIYDQLITPTPGDADIGKGLIAFLLIATVCGVWGLVDGLRHSPVLWALPWALTGLALAVGWDYLPGFGDPDDALQLDLFTALLVGVPALGGAGFGWLVTRGSRVSTPAT